MFYLFPTLGLLLVVCFTDLRYRKIPNVVLVVSATYGLIVSFLGIGQVGISDALLGFLVGLLVFSFPYYKAWIGAGDVKLMAVLGIYLGPTLTMTAAVYSMLAGGILALIYSAQPAQFKKLLGNLSEFKTGNQQMPYACAIFLGTCLAILISQE
jgi:prepilin peptidase CpaA